MTENQTKSLQVFYDEDYYGGISFAEASTRHLRPNKKRELDFYKSLYTPKSGEKLLDIGCGTGDYLVTVEETRAELWGIDISNNAAEVAKRRLKRPEKILCQSADPLPFRDGEFDAVTSFGSIEHIPNLDSILSEIHRVLKKGGHAILMVPNLYYYQFIWKTLRKGTGPVRHQLCEQLYSFGEWKNLIEKAGFKILRLRRHNKFNKPLLMWLRELLIPFYLSNHFAFVCTKV